MLVFGSAPLVRSKACCSFSVTGPRRLAPICRLSTSRIGVTSAAVPVKKASVGNVDVIACEALGDDAQAEVGGQRMDGGAGDAQSAPGDLGLAQHAVLDDENVPPAPSATKPSVSSSRASS